MVVNFYSFQHPVEGTLKDGRSRKIDQLPERSNEQINQMVRMCVKTSIKEPVNVQPRQAQVFGECARLRQRKPIDRQVQYCVGNFDKLWEL